ncbi:MAG: hypothetical protein HGB06_07065 [Chlorobaculum sp.]|nr:hypothetical protein [Chlorobaculum sp.]
MELDIKIIMITNWNDMILWKFCILLPQILLNGLVAMWKMALITSKCSRLIRLGTDQENTGMIVRGAAAGRGMDAAQECRESDGQ